MLDEQSDITKAFLGATQRVVELLVAQERSKHLEEMEESRQALAKENDRLTRIREQLEEYDRQLKDWSGKLSEQQDAILDQKEALEQRERELSELITSPARAQSPGSPTGDSMDPRLAAGSQQPDGSLASLRGVGTPPSPDQDGTTLTEAKLADSAEGNDCKDDAGGEQEVGSDEYLDFDEECVWVPNLGDGICCPRCSEVFGPDDAAEFVRCPFCTLAMTVWVPEHLLLPAVKGVCPGCGFTCIDMREESRDCPRCGSGYLFNSWPVKPGS